MYLNAIIVCKIIKEKKSKWCHSSAAYHVNAEWNNSVVLNPYDPVHLGHLLFNHPEALFYY